jgi:hypothetical protein
MIDDTQRKNLPPAYWKEPSVPTVHSRSLIISVKRKNEETRRLRSSPCIEVIMLDTKPTKGET